MTVVRWLVGLLAAVFPTQFDDGVITGQEIGYMIGVFLVTLGVHINVRRKSEVENS